MSTQAYVVLAALAFHPDGGSFCLMFLGFDQLMVAVEFGGLWARAACSVSSVLPAVGTRWSARLAPAPGPCRVRARLHHGHLKSPPW
jgi:hypothetical protein